jgi:putative transposase
MIVQDIDKTKTRSNWQLHRILGVLGLKRSVYYSWRERLEQGQLADKHPLKTSQEKVLPEEERAVIDFALKHTKEGYRRLCWMMVDADVAYLKPGTVYNILSRHDLMYRWKRSQSIGKKVDKPSQANQRWHTDIMYLWIKGRWYFYVGVIDGYSRYLVHGELLESMRADEVSSVVQRALEKYPGVKPEIVNDNGTQFTSHEFKRLIKRFELSQIRIRIQHPESNGTIERFFRNLRDGLTESELNDLGQAREIIKGWVEYYNNERLHAGIRYLRPKNYYYGEPDKLIAQREEKLRTARERRKEANNQSKLEQNPLRQKLHKSLFYT